MTRKKSLKIRMWRMLYIRLALLLPLLFLIWQLLLYSSLLGQSQYKSLQNKPKQIIIAESYLGNKEVKPNRGRLQDIVNVNVGNPLGAEWCSAFVKWCLDLAGIIMPQRITGLARSQVNKNSFTAWDVINGKKKIKAGYILIWQKGTTIFGHTCFADEDWNGIKGKTIEGNCNNQVKFMNRKIEPFNYFRIKWVTPI